MKMVAEKFVERTVIEIFDMIKFEDLSSYVVVTSNK